MANKQEIITFKVDEALGEVIKRLPNRSEFIRNAVLNALENTCPLCQGKGTITPEQHRHWDEFMKTHRVVKCPECDAVYIKCEVD